jgi:hypothetical protein
MTKNILIRFLAGFFSLLALVSSAHAYATLARECHLGTWCPLNRPEDIASFHIFPKLGSNYVCILYAGSSANGGRMVSVNISGVDGFDLQTTNFSTQEGTTAQKPLRGGFHGDRGLIAVTRLTDAVENPMDVRILCRN